MSADPEPSQRGENKCSETNSASSQSSERTFKCDFLGCSVSFRRRDKLEIHHRLHTGERPFVCDAKGCCKSFIRAQHLSRHKQRVHEKIDHHKHLKCENCGDAFTNWSTLHSHFTNVHQSKKTKNHVCPEAGCGLSFHKKKQLYQHHLTHVGHYSLSVKVIKCPHEGCGKTFTYPNRLRRHIKVHEGVRCDVEDCGELLPTWSKLRKHKADVHTPKKCKICGAVFKQLSSLNQHHRTHDTTREALVCPEPGCERIYYYKKNLRQHIRAFHQGEGIWRKRKKQACTEKKHKSQERISLAAKLLALDDRPQLCLE